MAQQRNVGHCLVWGALLGGLLMLPGCSHQKRVYQPNPADPLVQTLPLKIAVVELEDGTQEAGWKKGEFLNEALIPFVPSATILVKLNDTRFGKCLSAELKASRQFSIVDYHENWGKMADQFKTYDLIVTGRLHQDRTDAALNFYGLSVPGSLLWYPGMPSHSYSRHILLNVTAFRPFEPEHMLWNQEVNIQDNSYHGLYYGQFTDGETLRHKVYGGNDDGTDFCPTEILQPHFLALRNNLAAATKDKVLLQGATSLQKQ